MRDSLLAVALTAVAVVVRADEAKPVFERDVRPVLRAACFHCHGEDEELAGGLDLRLRRLMVTGGESGSAIDPGDPDSSYLLDRIRSGEMPPEGAGHVSEEDVATIERWIAAGAPTLRPEPEKIGRGLLITAEDRSWWSFQPVERPAVPRVQRPELVATPIDAFLLAKLEAEGLSFSSPAERRTLIRRLSFSLRGLPPSPEEVAAFEADTSPAAWERLVDRFLASPAYGERWGRHWLDVAGYADSEGVVEADVQRKWAWKYRDWVVNALNDDMPYDQFVREQLAGDELLGRPPSELTEDEVARLTATGFLRTAPDGTASGGLDPGVARNQVVADTIEIVGSSLLGMTVQCAQCHEHRYDPIPQADYYALRAVFEPALDWKAWKTPPQRLVSLETEADRSRAAEIEAEAKQIEAKRSEQQAKAIEAVFQRELAKLPDDEREAASTARKTEAKKRTDEQKALLRKYPSLNVSAGSLYLYDKKAADALKKLADQAAAVRRRKPRTQFVRALVEPAGHAPSTFLFHRGDHEQPKEKVQPAGLTVLRTSDSSPIPADDPSLDSTGRRLAFANHLVSGRHPLVARVVVNRLWRHHFGRGLVATPGDFGRLGERPTHPELLDWFADELVRSGWSLKHLHRRILLSSAYQQSSTRTVEQRTADPENTLLGGFRMQRLEAEVLRDSLLALSGRINRKPFGPPIPVMADRVGQWVIGKENLNAGRPGAVIPMKGEEFRRSIYVEARRSRPLAVLEVFDLPRMEPHCNARSSSTVAPQSLLLVNGPFVVEASAALAKRVTAEAGDADADRVRLAWRLVYSRDPRDEELAVATAFLAEQTADLATRAGEKDAPATQALASLCQVLLGSNEFLYVD